MLTVEVTLVLSCVTDRDPIVSGKSNPKCLENDMGWAYLVKCKSLTYGFGYDFSLASTEFTYFWHCFLVHSHNNVKTFFMKKHGQSNILAHTQTPLEWGQVQRMDSSLRASHNLSHLKIFHMSQQSLNCHNFFGFFACLRHISSAFVTYTEYVC